MPVTASEIVDRFSVALTGAQPGQLLVGVSNGSKGGMLRLVGNGRIPPLRTTVSAVKSDEAAWKKFLQKLARLPAFKDKPLDQRAQAIDNSAEDLSPNLPLAQISGLKLEVITLPQTMLERLTSEEMERITAAGTQWTTQELLSLPGLNVPGSNKQSLVFLTKWWRVDSAPAFEDTNDIDCPGMCIGIDSGEVYSDAVLCPEYMSRACVLEVPCKTTNTVATPVRTPFVTRLFAGGSFPDFSTLCFRQAKALFRGQAAAPVDVAVLESIKLSLDDAFQGFGPSVFKSAMQKIIRFAPQSVVLPNGGSVDAHIALVYCMTRLRDGPGQFVPDIQRWVSGLESLTKRLGIIAFEDANPLLDPPAVLNLLASAMLAQRTPSWKPAADLQIGWFASAVRLYLSDTALCYDTTHGRELPPYYLHPSNSALQNASALLDEVRSFQGDIAMARDVACRADPTLVPQRSTTSFDATTEKQTSAKRSRSEAGLSRQTRAAKKQRKPVESSSSSSSSSSSESSSNAVPGETSAKRYKKMSVAPLPTQTRSAGRRLPNVSALSATVPLAFRSRFPAMPLPEHAVDQHVNPNIVYLFSPAILKTIPFGPSGAPFRPLLSKVFTEVTGVNLRRIDASEREAFRRAFETDPFVKETRRVQALYCRMVQQRRRVSGAAQEDGQRRVRVTVEMEEKLDVSWISGMIGVLNVGSVDGVPMVVTLATNNPFHLVAVRAPSRTAGDNELRDPRRQEAAKEKARAMLRKGVPLDKIKPVPHPSLAGHHARLISDADGNPERYEIFPSPLNKKPALKTDEKQGEGIPWEQARVLKLSVTVHEPLQDLSFENAACCKGRGVEEGWADRLQMIFADNREEVLRRALYYTTANSARLKMRNVSRDGGGTEGAVVPADIEAYQLLCKASIVMPGALTLAKGSPFTFLVQNLPLLWKLRRSIASYLSSLHTSVPLTPSGTAEPSSLASQPTWPEMTDSLNRDAMEHQLSAVQSLITAQKRGLPGSFLYVPPGMGKTLIVLLFLKYLAEAKKLPPYVLYTLPKSAMKNVVHEIVALGVAVTVVRPVKSVKAVEEAKKVLGGVDPRLVRVVRDVGEIERYRITMVEHDDLRVIEKGLTALSSEGFCFVNDEVHKTVATGTKRTSVAQELASLSRSFVALTGTPIVSSSAFPLITWLERIVPFTVNGQNFWVAANSMVAHSVSTGVKTHRHDIAVPIPPPRLHALLSHLPPGITCGNQPGRLANPKPIDFRSAADICYSICDEAMVKHVADTWEADGVMLIVRDKAHQARMVDAVAAAGVPKTAIFALGFDAAAAAAHGVGGGPSIFLTSEAVEKKSIPPYRVVVVPVRKAEGYSLTYLTSCVTSVYPCNAATREQLDGRVNRISQRADTVSYFTFHCGILTYIRENHLKAHDLATALKSMAKEVDATLLSETTNKSLE
ncbi:hypothetical protein DIPPA_14936 [Diplonema papillatum]|nr:hypothetical protein DIPPA_14936 [Diplonema papillatum]